MPEEELIDDELPQDELEPEADASAGEATLVKQDPGDPEDPCDDDDPADNPQPILQATAEGEKELAGVELVKKETAQETLPQVQKKMDSLRVIEAALFLGNKPLNFAELALVAKTSVRKAREIAERLRGEYDAKGGSLEVVVNAQEASLQVKPEFVGSVSELSKDVDVSRKGTKMLSLIAKKGKLLQSELKKYFRGEIYAYVHELKERGYITSDKAGATRLLRPTEKFRETFQMST